MKLVTTFAALELLGPEFHWTTTAYLDGPLEAGVLHGNLVLKGGGDPKITLERWQAFMAMLRDKGLSSVEGDLVLDRTFFAPIAHDAGAFDGEPLKPYNVGPDALLVNFKSVKFGFAPGAAADAAVETVEPSLRAVALGAPPKLGAGPCGDWRATIGASFVDQGTRAEAAFAGRYPASCGERDWWVSLLDHPTYVHGMFDTYFRAAGGRFTGGWRDGVAPAARRAVRHARFAAAVGRGPRHQQAVEQRHGAAALPHARHRARPAARDDRTRDGNRASRGSRRRNLRMPELVLDNGSGLSRRERISAGSLARLLIAADASPVREEFASSLSVAAMDGTLQRRFLNGSVAGQALLEDRERSTASGRWRAT